MATGKKSFLLYADLIHTFEGLSDEEAGKLIKTILDYVNDKNPEVNDKLIKIAFEPIKQQLKRDLKRYETIIEKRSAAGKKSAESRINKSQQVSTNVKSVEHNQHMSTDNVNDTVNDNEINNSKMSRVVPTSGVDFDKFMEMFNGFVGRKFRLNEKIKTALRSRVKEYTPKEIKKAIETAHKDPFHIKTNYQYLTPEYILRAGTLDKYLNNIGFGEVEKIGYTPQMPN